MKLAVPDMISNSYFPAIAAIELGFFKKAGLDVELEMIFPVDKTYAALRDGTIELVAGSAHSALAAFPDWQGVRQICAQRARPNPGLHHFYRLKTGQGRMGHCRLCNRQPIRKSNV